MKHWEGAREEFPGMSRNYKTRGGHNSSEIWSRDVIANAGPCPGREVEVFPEVSRETCHFQRQVSAVKFPFKLTTSGPHHAWKFHEIIFTLGRIKLRLTLSPLEKPSPWGNKRQQKTCRITIRVEIKPSSVHLHALYYTSVYIQSKNISFEPDWILGANDELIIIDKANFWLSYI